MKHKVLLSFAGSSMLLSVVQLVANVLILRWVPPEELGVWHTIVVLKSYALIFNIGVSNGLNRELPFLLGKKHIRLARSVAQSALFVSLVAAVTVLLLFSSWALFSTDYNVRLSLLVVAVVSATTFINIYYGTTFRTNQAFFVFSKINAALITIELLTLILPALYGFSGFLLRLVVIELLKLILFLKFQPFPVFPRFRWLPFKFLVSTGMPLFISDYLSAITETFKRVILKGASSFEMVGLFAPALAVYTLNGLLPQTMGRYIFPKLNYGIGQGHSMQALWEKNLKFSLLCMLLMVPIVLVGWFAAPPAIRFMFPEYSVGAHAAQIALFSGLFMPFAMLMNFFHAIKHWASIYTLIAIKLVLLFVLQWSFVRIMPPLEGVAYGTLIAQVIYAVVIVLFGFWYIKRLPTE
jgi:O-antigen/teichoic acid export membrane protein